MKILLRNGGPQPLLASRLLSHGYMLIFVLSACGEVAILA